MTEEQKAKKRIRDAEYRRRKKAEKIKAEKATKKVVKKAEVKKTETKKPVKKAAKKAAERRVVVERIELGDQSVDSVKQFMAMVRLLAVFFFSLDKALEK